MMKGMRISRSNLKFFMRLIDNLYMPELEKGGGLG